MSEIKIDIGIKNINNTDDFFLVLQKGEIDVAEAWLANVENNPSQFPQYQSARWLADRKLQIAFYKNLNEKGFLPLPFQRSKEQAQEELIQMFNIKDTNAFKMVLKEAGQGKTDKIQLAVRWLKHIEKNLAIFPQYAGLTYWFEERRKDIHDIEMIWRSH
ncbi:MAG: TIGR02269 family lipoprotein [Planctomycetes bacterium]|nr:TIGR02269 family lipoprotein [Planctomycetota bacterium]